MAALDPLARREFLASLAEAVADSDLSVILSSHLLHDLQRVCDHLILLGASRTQLTGDIDDVLRTHRWLVGPRRRTADIEPGIDVIKAVQTANQTRLLARLNGPVLDPSWEISEIGLEDIVLAYMGRDDTRTCRSADHGKARPVSALIWRLHRHQAFVAGAALAALTCLLLITGFVMARDYDAFLSSCATTRSCGDATQLLFRGDGAITTLVAATMAVPLLLGVFWGAPLLAREFETGTHNLAWTQGITRRGWLTGNVLWALAAAAVWGATMTILVSWWRGPETRSASRPACHLHFRYSGDRAGPPTRFSRWPWVSRQAR